MERPQPRPSAGIIAILFVHVNLSSFSVCLPHTWSSGNGRLLHSNSKASLLTCLLLSPFCSGFLGYTSYLALNKELQASGRWTQTEPSPSHLKGPAQEEGGYKQSPSVQWLPSLDLCMRQYGERGTPRPFCVLERDWCKNASKTSRSFNTE